MDTMSDPRKATLQEFEAAVARYEDSDAVNPVGTEASWARCAYVSLDGTKTCLIGRIWLDLGGDVETLREMDRRTEKYGAYHLFDDRLVRAEASTLQELADKIKFEDRSWSDAMPQKLRTWGEAIAQWQAER